MAELQDISPDQLKDIVQQHEKWLESATLHTLLEPDYRVLTKDY